jgi:hypothetical protein
VVAINNVSASDGKTLGKFISETFQMIKQAYGEETWAIVLCLSGTNVLHRGENVWKMMSIPFGQEQSEPNSSSKKLQRWCVPTAPKQWIKLQQQQQGLAMALATTCLVLPSGVFHQS